MSQAPAQREEPSMEDILSSIRKIIQSNDDGAEDVAAPAEVVSEPVAEVTAPEPVASAPQVQAEPVQQQAPVAREETPVSEQGDLTSAPERAREVVSEPVAVAAEEETPAPAQSQAQAPAPASTNEQTSANSALISAGSEAKVAASFAQLNDAITASSSQSLEEMANDMLKPMLQEWLDNNLPGLVEKLVREEIERVARGGHES
ncbi:MAG: DUF2497 domain-containing protein [Lentilitoribacter sp.]